MKKQLFMLLSAATVLLTVGCGGGKPAAQTEVEEDSTQVNVIPTDQTIYGLCGEGSAMNTLQLLTDNGDSITLNITAASEANKVLGGFQVGDRMAVLANKNRTEATLVINQSTLLGNWVMPNPIDGSSEIGISIKEGGVAESIDQSTIIYKTWKIFNGKLEILSVREGGGDEEELNLYEIVALGPDSLVYKDSEDTFEYTRQRTEEKHDLRGLHLEDAEKEFRLD